MKKHPILTILTILLVCGLLIGISATDLWNYIIEFCKVGINLFVAWLNEMVIALRDAFNTAIASNG